LSVSKKAAEAWPSAVEKNNIEKRLHFRAIFIFLSAWQWQEKQALEFDTFYLIFSPDLL
jgi:hypothetical protein